MKETAEGAYEPNLGLRWVIPEWVLSASFAEMSVDGRREREGIALWAGRRSSDDGDARKELLSEATVSYVVVLRGTGVFRARGQICITPELLNDVTDRLAALGDDVYLVGQVHGHPPFSSTDLSYTDVTYGIRTPDFLSVVAPHYGTLPHDMLRGCGVHVFESRKGWRRLEASEIARRLVVTAAPETAPGLIVVETDTSLISAWGKHD